LLEAAAMEKPAVALRAGAVEEALPPECGRLVEPGPYQETRLAQALLELIRDEPARRAMGAAARALVRRQHSLDQMRSSYRELFRELLDG